VVKLKATPMLSGFFVGKDNIWDWFKEQRASASMPEDELHIDFFRFEGGFAELTYSVWRIFFTAKYI
jgi:hypothetical protein